MIYNTHSSHHVIHYNDIQSISLQRLTCMQRDRVCWNLSLNNMTLALGTDITLQYNWYQYQVPRSCYLGTNFICIIVDCSQTSNHCVMVRWVSALELSSNKKLSCCCRTRLICHLGCDRTENSAIRSANPENPSLEPKSCRSANRLQSYWHFVYPKWPSAAILDFIEPQIAPFNPPTPKTLAWTWTWTWTWSGSAAPFAR